MKSKQDVKYLIATMLLSLTASTTLSATETNKDNETETHAEVIETIQAIPVVEDTTKVAIPVLAKPNITAEEVTLSEAAVSDEALPDEALPYEALNAEPMPTITNKTNRYIPLLDDAVIFANLDDELPAVANYYTQMSEQAVIDFYQQSFGEAASQERKRERLTLIYLSDDLVKRVVISQQNDKRQVDVMVEQAAN
jgi:hypothetical protein